MSKINEDKELESEKSSNVNDENPEDNNFPTIGIINEIQLYRKDKNNKNSKIIKDDKIIICGKMLTHTSLGKYSFEACNFHIYNKSKDKLYYSVMNSDDCFSSQLKWNYKYFKKIRECLLSKNFENIKDFFFIICKENEEGEEDDDIISKNDTKYLELHFIKNKKDIVSFRLLLQEIEETSKLIFFINKIQKLDNEYEVEFVKKQRKEYKHKEEIKNLQKEINDINEKNNLELKEMLIKFNLLNEAKNQKIIELNDKIKNKDDEG